MVRKAEGITLIELLMVISIFAIIAVFATPNLLSWRSNARLRGAASNLKGDMELAKLKAIQINDTVTIHFTPGSYQIFKDNLTPYGQYNAGDDLYGNRTLPSGVKIDLGKTNFDDECARFKGRGTADPGSAILVNASGTEKTVTVSGLGRITIKSSD